MRGVSKTRKLWAVLAAVAVLGAGCREEPDETPDETPGDPLPVDPPSTDPVWNWVDFPNTQCDEGTPTGLGVNLTHSKNLVIFFNGGGACWDASTCLERNLSTHGPFTKTQFDQLAPRISVGNIFDRGLASNPYKDWNHFFIPYCTGDLHIGNADNVYTSGSVSVTIHHKGRPNAEAFLARIAATVPEPEQVVVTGSSAGGYGAVLNYTLVRSHFPKAKVFLLDDSGPMLRSDAINPLLRAAWSNAWKYDAVMNDIDPAVKDDFSAIHPALARKYPEDRMALLSSTQDQVIRGYMGLAPDRFQAALLDLSSSVLEPLAHSRAFIVPGQSHTMLLNPGDYSAQGVPLLEWINQMHTADDATWKTLRP
ncbi:esterase [Cystobacter fuscus]|uniref:pectin acetylesterase-family hydrolase n=1 Tax=Cystobacter fuscus TaxID=43 RepID=UPI002B2B69AC|nr:esterase [Cystobacter fuscus]